MNSIDKLLQHTQNYAYKGNYMTVKSNKFKSNKIISCIKDKWDKGGIELLFIPFIIVFTIGGLFLEHRILQSKVKLIKTTKPKLVCTTYIRCGEESYSEYKLVKIDGDYMIEIKKDNKSSYLKLDNYDPVEIIK